MSVIKMTAEQMELNERLHAEYTAGIVAQDKMLQEQERARRDPNVEALDAYAKKALRKARSSPTYQSPTHSYRGGSGVELVPGLPLGIVIGGIL